MARNRKRTKEKADKTTLYDRLEEKYGSQRKACGFAQQKAIGFVVSLRKSQIC